MLFLLLIFLLPTATLAQSPDNQDAAFLAGLRQRGLFELAESYCRQRLVEADLPVEQGTELALQWART
ncbi:MAG: hypothetical protein JW818_01145, partial [Pirellulales bacterium]|nr:hypothetical protein [Pirellulales bacterium]